MGKFKENFNFITNILFLIIILFASIVWADSNGVWHYASDVRGGIFALDEQNRTNNFTFINPVNFGENVTYKGFELDTRYVNTMEPNSIVSSMIVDGSLVYQDTNVDSIQRRILGTCNVGESIVEILANGTVVCSKFIGGAGIDITNNTIKVELEEITTGMVKDGTITYKDVNLNSIQKRVIGTCNPGYSIRVIKSDGTVTCEKDDLAKVSGSCTSISWTGGGGHCPSGYVMTGAQARSSDSGEWDSFTCCRLS